MKSIILSIVTLIAAVYGWQQGCSSVTSIAPYNPQTADYAISCASENGGDCYGPGRIYYGSGNTWAYKDIGVNDQLSCSNAAWGCDPTPNKAKSCYRACPNNLAALPGGGYNVCATQTDGRTCSGGSNGRRIYYGFWGGNQ